MKKFLSILLIILFFSSLALVSASDANGTCLDKIQTDQPSIAPTTVEPKETLGNSEESPKLANENEGSFSDLRKLIKNTPENGVINLTKDYTFFESDINDFITISKSITINGNNRTINGKNSTGVFEITGGKIFLNNMIFKNNNNTKSIICVTEGFCKISNSTFTDNYARQALIYGKKDQCDIYNSNFIGNDAGWGIVYFYPNGGYIDNCLFLNNSGISVYFAATACIYNTRFINNSNQVICTFGSKNDEINITNCTIFNNHIFKQSLIFIRSSSKVCFYNSTFKNNSAENNYILWLDQSAIINKCTFENNYASQGGAIYSNGYMDTIEIYNSIFKNNIASEAGGAIYISYDSLIIKNNTMEGNKAKYGNNIYFECSNYYKYNVTDFYLTISNNSTIYSNGLVEIEITLTDDMGNDISGLDVVFQINGQDIASKSLINGKTSFLISPHKIGENILSAYLINMYDNIIVKNATLISTINPYSGPIYVSVNGDDSNNGDRNNPLKSIQHAIDLASALGVNVIITEGTYKQHNLKITSNNLEIIGEGNVILDGEDLGRLFTVTKNFNLSNVKIINTKSISNFQYTLKDFEKLFDNNYLQFNLDIEGVGGAIFAPSNNCIINVQNVTFDNNKANFGGAIFTFYRGYESLSNLTIIDCKFINNTAEQAGGAINSLYDTYIYNSQFLNNKVLKTQTSQGGAIFANYANITFSSFENNAASFGGSIFSIMVSVSQSSFINNNATYGGAIYTRSLYTFNNLISGSSTPQDKGLFVIEDVKNAVIVILNNKTIETNLNYYDVNAIITDDIGNPISGVYIGFSLNGDKISYIQIFNGSASLRISLESGINTVSADLAYHLIFREFYSYSVNCFNATIISNSNPYLGPIYVSVDGDDSGSGDINNPLKSLNLAIDLATKIYGSKKVILKEGTYYFHNIKIFRDLEIVGEGKVIIDAQGKGRIFKFDTQEPYLSKLSNLILMNGNASNINSLERIEEDYLLDLNDVFKINYDLGFGGAIYSLSPLFLENITFINNHANLGGAFFARDIEGNNTKFINNSAFEYNNGVYYNSQFLYPQYIEEGFELLDIIYFSNYASGNFWVDNVIPFTHGNYTVFSTEEFINYISFGFVTKNLNFYRNAFDDSDVIEYLKILMFNHRNETFELQKAIWIFTDGKYWESSHPWVVETINQYNQGNLIADSGNITLNNGTVIEYEFKGIYSPREDFFYYVYPNKDLLRAPHIPGLMEQSDFLMIRYSQTNNNLTVDKYTLNKTVWKNEIVEFLITITNTGNVSISSAFIEDSDYSPYLMFVSWVSKSGNWIFNQNQMRWYYDGELAPGESASIIVKFKALQAGILTNNVTAGFNNLTFANSTNTTEVLKNETHENVSDNQTEENIIEEDLTADTPDELEDSKLKDKEYNSEDNNSNNVIPQNNPTGNPILLLLIILIALPALRRRL
ncbi:MAG: hypothetical protein E7Z76_01830 [Methanobrevibacter sp.]|nr:hypothetical protein [Methanobrevibacter sp.]